MEERLKEKLQEIPNPFRRSRSLAEPNLHTMRQFFRDSYSLDYTGEQETVQHDDEEDYNFLISIIFESRFMKFVLLFVKKLYYLPYKFQKFPTTKNPLINLTD